VTVIRVRLHLYQIFSGNMDVILNEVVPVNVINGTVDSEYKVHITIHGSE